MSGKIAFFVVLTGLIHAGCSSVDGENSDDLRPEASARIPASVSIAALSCTGCHSDSQGTGIPALAGLSRDELDVAMTAYQQDMGGTSVMHRIARGYTSDQIADLADYIVSEN